MFLAIHAAPRRRRRPKLTGAPPPTQWRRRTALLDSILLFFTMFFQGGPWGPSPRSATGTWVFHISPRLNTARLRFRFDDILWIGLIIIARINKIDVYLAHILIWVSRLNLIPMMNGMSWMKNCSANRGFPATRRASRHRPLWLMKAKMESSDRLTV